MGRNRILRKQKAQRIAQTPRIWVKAHYRSGNKWVKLNISNEVLFSYKK
jgi:hypothetical protein